MDWNAIPYLEAVLGFKTLVYAWETYLDIRQHGRHRVKILSKELKALNFINQEQFEKTQAYNVDKSLFSFAADAFTIVHELLLLWYKAIPWLWYHCADYSKAYVTENPFGTVFLFFLAAMLYSKVVSLPWSLYSTFVIEERHGFNKTSLGLYVKDTLLGLLLTLAIGTPVLWIVLYLIEWGGQYFYLYVWGFLSLFSFVLMLAYPMLIMPLFNKFDPLPDAFSCFVDERVAKQLNEFTLNAADLTGAVDWNKTDAALQGKGSEKEVRAKLEAELGEQWAGLSADEKHAWAVKLAQRYYQQQLKSEVKEPLQPDALAALAAERWSELSVSAQQPYLEKTKLREEIFALAGRCKFPLKLLFTMDGSKRSGHSNAFFTGFGSQKRIVLFDTLITQLSVGELVGVLGHEIGHWVYGHIYIMLAVAQTQLLIFFWLFAQMQHSLPLFRSFGFEALPAQSAFLALILFSYLLEPLDAVLTFLMNYQSRKHEYQSDSYAVTLGYAAQLKTSLCKLQVENKGSLDPDPLFSAYHHSHPTLLERIRAIDQQAKKKQ